MVFCVVNVILTEESLESLVMNIVSFPTEVILAHLDVLCFSFS
jgi:hypothetical protein